MNLRMLWNNVLIKPVKEDEVVISGIIVSANNTEIPSEGTVIAIGNGKVLENGSTQPMSVCVGDTVVFTKYVGREVVYNNEKYLCLPEDNIMYIKD
ncbi:MAG: chaperonin GroES [Bacteroidota bacterium]|nr:chaperonin GroES [Bacteroidota bacterium]